MIENYVYVIIALLPLSALILVLQVDPYNALVVRAILGAVSVLVYAILGAADVALTEALVGTMLAVTLYIIAVRSSLIMRLGIVQGMDIGKESYLSDLIDNLTKVIDKYHLRLEIIEYPDLEALEQALITKEVHATCIKQEQEQELIQLEIPSLVKSPAVIDTKQTYYTAIRVPRLFEIMQTESLFNETTLDYVTVSNVEEKH